MTLTRSIGPLSGTAPQTVNYRIEGPPHRLMFHPFPRRVRAELAGTTVLDTRHGMLLHETGLTPRLYVPDADLDGRLLEPTDHSTHCPFKGDATYRSIRVGDRVVENAVWTYPEPLPAASWLLGYASVYWEAADTWYDEDEEVVGHLPDPFHRVDVRSTARHVQVLAGDTLLAESRRPLVLSETGLPNRWYLPAADIVAGLVEPSPTRTRCPYKGEASYWTATLPDGGRVADVGWSYETPLPEAARIAGHRAFNHDGITVLVDGEPS